MILPLRIELAITLTSLVLVNWRDGVHTPEGLQESGGLTIAAQHTDFVIKDQSGLLA
jgi:hypothetical protein